MTGKKGIPFRCSLLSVSLEPFAVHTAGRTVAEGNPEELFAQVHVVLRVLVCSLGKKHCCICARGGQPTPPGISLPALRSDLLTSRKFCLIVCALTQCFRSS